MTKEIAVKYRPTDMENGEIRRTEKIYDFIYSIEDKIFDFYALLNYLKEARSFFRFFPSFVKNNFPTFSIRSNLHSKGCKTSWK